MAFKAAFADIIAWGLRLDVEGLIDCVVVIAADLIPNPYYHSVLGAFWDYYAGLDNLFIGPQM